MTKKLQDATFSKLVQDIDKKWGHTYIDVKEEDLALEAAEKAGWNKNDFTSNFFTVDELPLNDKA
jgi:hypothetical protein